MSTEFALFSDSDDSDPRSHFSDFNSQDVHDMEEIADNLSDFDFDDIDASSESSIDNDDDENNASASDSDTEELVVGDLAWEMTAHPPNWSCDNLPRFPCQGFQWSSAWSTFTSTF